jgi:hypothetical protein
MSSACPGGRSTAFTMRCSARASGPWCAGMSRTPPSLPRASDA